MLLFYLLFPLSLRFAAAGSAPTILSAIDPTSFSYFVTRPDIEAPLWDIRIYNQTALRDDLYWFVAPYDKLDQETYPMWNGPFIYRTNGELIWSGGSKFGYNNVHDFRMAVVEGSMMLSLIVEQPHVGSAQIYNERYKRHKAVRIAHGSRGPNMHELNLIDNGRTALVLLKEDPEEIPLTAYMNCNARFEGFLEVDVATNDFTFEWDPREWIMLNESDEFHRHKDGAQLCEERQYIDALHVNSLDKFPDGDYLLSARNTDCLYKISHIDGSIVWRLGGPLSDFAFGEDARFQRQHHARVLFQNDTHIAISVFDNAVAVGYLGKESKTKRSSGLILALRTDSQPMKAEVIHRYDKPFWQAAAELEEDDSRNKTRNRGSMQILPDGNAFMGWVQGTHISEHSPDGTLLMQARFHRPDVATYRTYKMPWIGRPAQPPDVVAKLASTSDGQPHTTVYVSWNGATEVATWRISDASWRFWSRKTIIASQPSSGFETVFRIEGHWRKVVAIGVDAAGRVLGRSGTITATDPYGRTVVSHNGLFWVGTLGSFVAFIVVRYFHRRFVSRLYALLWGMVFGCCFFRSRRSYTVPCDHADRYDDTNRVEKR